MLVSIRLKLLLLIIVANVLLVAVFAVLNALTFERSFSEYVKLQEARRLSPLIINIAKTYDQQGSWSWIKRESPLWQKVIRESLAVDSQRFPAPTPNSRQQSTPPMEPQFVPQQGLQEQLPLDYRGQPQLSPQQQPQQRPQQGGGNRPPRDARIPYLDRLVIKDANGKLVLGERGNKKRLLWLPIKSIEHGTVIGKLGFEPNARLDAQFDKLFSQKLKQQLIWFGLLVLVISATFTIPFSGWLVRPILRLTKAMRDMTDGDFSVSVNETRKDELGQLALDFNKLASVLQHNSDARHQWVTDIAHELRTPLAVLQADVEAAQDGIRKVDSKWLHAMQSQVGRLGQLVNDLHSLSQSDAGTLNYRFEPVDIGDIIEEVTEQNSHGLDKNFIKLNMNLPQVRVWIRGDGLRLVQLLNNLMQNTLRYTDGEAQTLGSLSILLTSNSTHAQLIWQDSSPSVGAQDLPKLFDRLYRVDESRNRNNGGSGLGLAIAKNIVEAHGGSITAKQSKLGGLSIEVLFPLVKEARK